MLLLWMGPFLKMQENPAPVSSDQFLRARFVAVESSADE